MSQDRITRTRGARRRLLTRLAMAQGRIVPDEALALAVYGADGPEDADGVIKVIICHLRKRLPAGAILRERGLGYRLDPAVAATLPEVDERLLVPAELNGDEVRG